MLKSFLFSCALLCVANTSFCQQQASTKIATKTPATKLVKLYSTPEQSASVITQLAVTTPLVRIYQKNPQWVKVGITSNGQVGWINRKQYHQAVNAMRPTRSQTIIIRSSSTDNGKTTEHVNIIENGKQLSDHEVKKRMQSILEQEKQQRAAMQRWEKRMQLWMNDSWPALYWPTFRSAPIERSPQRLFKESTKQDQTPHTNIKTR